MDGPLPDFVAALMSGAVGACNASTAASSAALSRFGFSLFANLCHANPAHNVVLSPLVVAGALSMAVAGATAGGKTEQELLGLLGLSTHADFAVLTSAVLASSGASVSAANGIFTRAAVRPDFVALVRSAHGAYADKLGSSYGPINQWVSEKTQGHIRDLLSDPVDPLTVAVLVSAVFFKGSWATKFDAALTAASVFSALDGRALPAMMMRRSGTLHASASVDELAGAAAVRLDYGAGDGPHDFCALLVLPPEPGATALAATVLAMSSGDASGTAMLSRLHPQRVDLELPRLKAEYGAASLKVALRSLGLVESFDGHGGFLGLSQDEAVRIDDVVTKAMLEVDEEGTTAAAAAAVIMRTKSAAAPRPPLRLAFDRPFVMAVLHVPTGVPLFVAQLNEPAVPAVAHLIGDHGRAHGHGHGHDRDHL